MTRLWWLMAVLATGAPVAAQSPAPPPAQATGVSGSTQAQISTLRALVAELERNNPEIDAARRTVDMAVARIEPAGALPDPTLTVGYMGGFTRPPFVPSPSPPGGFQRFAATQDVPFPGKRGLRTRIASIGADAERWNYEATRRRLVAELKDAYFEYALAQRSIDIVERNKERLEQFRQIAEAQFAVGRAIQQDVIKAQVEVSLLLERLALLDEQRRSAEARVNGLLYRPPDTPLGAAEAGAAIRFTQTVEELRALARANDASLKRDERAIDRQQQALELARKDVLPDFGINVSSQKVAGMPWMYGADFMVSVPLYWQRKQRPLIAEATAALDGGRRTRDNTWASAVARVTEGYVAATTSQRLVALYDDSVIPQARLALEASLASYQVGAVDFLTVLTNFVTVLDYELTYAEQDTRLRRALAALEPIVGVELVQ